MPKRYYELTNRGQVRRLRKMALKALEQYALEGARLRLIFNGFNCIFRIDTANRERYILRVALPEGGKTSANFEAETAWLAALARDTDLSVPAPLKTKDGKHVISVEVDGVPEARFCMVFTWVPGTNLSEHISVEATHAWGQLMAGLHEHAAGFTPPAAFELMRFDRVFPYPEPTVLFDDKYREIFPDERRRVYEFAIARTGEAIKDLQARGEPMQIIHADLHQWNVRYSRGVLSPIDFEDMMWGWPVQDIGIMLYYLSSRDDFSDLRASFRAGYETVLPWPEVEPGEIDAFIAFRGVDLVNFVLQSPNPDWRKDAEDFAGRVEERIKKLLME